MKKITTTLVLIFIAFQAFVQLPSPIRGKILNNFSSTGILSSDEEDKLETELENFEKSTSNEIAVIIVDDINNMEPWEYATKIGAEWGVGKEKEDNGIVLLIKPTKENGGRQVFIAVGRGLEGAIPDMATNDIVQNELLPNFKEGKYFEGIEAALNVLEKLSKGEYDYAQYHDKDKPDGFWVGFLVVIVIIIIVIIIIKKGGNNGGGFGSGRGGFFIVNGGWGGSSWGGGSSGGSSGFGGFGGGDFGGGGSGGSW